MTKNLFLILFISFFIACTSDSPEDMETAPDTDQNDSEEEIVDNEGMDQEEEVSVRLLKMIQNRFDGGNFQGKIEFYYEDNKFAVDSFYNISQELTFVHKWIYDENGLLSGTKGYLPNGTIAQENFYAYDELGRLTNRNSSEQEGTFITDVNFTYNDDNTITGAKDSGSGVSENIFYLNTDGLIYKEEFGNNVVEVMYEGEQVRSLNFNGNVTDYVYDNMNLPLGPFKNPLAKILGNNKNNIVLWGYSLADQASTVDGRFLLETRNSGDEISKIEYVFNGDGYPISKKRLSNGEITDEFSYVYE